MTVRPVDVVVIGCGPAGLAAAGVVAAAGHTCVAIDRMGPGGQLMNLGEIKGLAGLDANAMGPDLVASLTDKAMTAGAELAIDDVQRVTADGDGWLVEALEERFLATAVIIASGLLPGTTGLPSEAHYEGRGLSHCAHCDAPLYAGKPVVVAGGDTWAIEEAIELAAHASRVTLVVDGRLTASADRLARLLGLANVTAIDGRIGDLAGSETLEHVEIRGDGPPVRVAARGLFLYTGRVPARSFLDAALDNAGGHFWAGDVRPGSPPALAEAIADGERAGHTASEWVTNRNAS